MSLLGAPLSGDAFEVFFHGEPDGPNADRLSWASMTSLGLMIDQALALGEDSEGRIEPGLYDLHVQNANGHATRSETALAVVPRPTLTQVSPPLTCLAQGDRTLTVAGETLLRLEGQDPLVHVEGLDLPFALESFTGCADVPHPALSVSLCSGAELPLAEGAIPVGWPSLTLHNPETAACLSEEDVRLRVVPPPSIDRVEAPFVCAHESDRDVDVIGDDLLVVDGVFPQVTLDGQALEVLSAAGCEDLPTQGLSVERCTRLSVRVPMTATETVVRPVLAVVNPAPAGCEAASSNALVLAPPPRIEDVAPPVLCDSGIDQVLRLTGTHFFVIEGALPIVTVDSTTLDAGRVEATGCEPLPVPGLDVQSCTTLDVTVATSMVDGREATLSVSNPGPAGCGDTWAIPVPLVDLPAIASVEPALVCTDDGARALVLNGTELLVIDGRYPTVTLDGLEVAVTSAGGCEAATIGPVPGVERCISLTVTAPEGSLAPGEPLIAIQNPTPIACASEIEGPLVVAPTLRIDAVVPAGVCNQGSDSTLTIRGEGFQRIDGVAPTVTLAGDLHPVSVLVDCAAVPMPAGNPLGAVETCLGIELFITAGSLPPGDVPVSVTNPSPDGCAEVATGVLFSVPVPTVTAVEPPAICEGTTNTLTLTGTDFSPAAEVWLDRSDAPSVPATQVTYIDATTLEATFDEALTELTVGTWDVRVQNAVGCADTLPSALEVHPTPLIFFVDPPIIYNGITIQATVYLSGLRGAGATITLVSATGEEVDLEVTADGDDNRLRALIPAGLEPGTWSARVTSAIGCTSTTSGALAVTDDLSLIIDDVQPRFVWTERSTAVTMLSDDGGFIATPRAYLNPKDAPAGTPATAMRAVVFDNAQTVTGVVPAGLEVDREYEVIVINPDGAVGVFDAIGVTADPPPVIEAVIPASFNSNGPTRAAVIGEGFSADEGVSITMTCRSPMGALFGPLTAPVITNDPSDPPTDTRISANFPSGQVPAGSVCIVTLTNADGTSYDFSAVSTKTPAQNPNPWGTRPGLVEARRGAGASSGRPTGASRLLYVVGGDDGLSANAKATVESARVDLFGLNSAFELQRNALPAPRVFHGMARVGRFLYVAGGFDGTDTVGSLLRAEVLDPLATPELGDLSIRLVNTEASPGGEEPIPTGLSAGVWIYRVTAVFPADDPNNPGGESLPGEPIVVQLPDFDGLELTFTWDAIPGAVGYRIYRTPEAGQGLGDVRLLAETSGPNATSLSDGGRVVSSEESPLPPGSLGVWHAVGDGLVQPRQRLSLVAAPAPDDSGVAYLYAVGGATSAGTVLGDYEVARVLTTEPVEPKARQAQDLDPFVSSGPSLSLPRADLGAWVITEREVLAAARGQTWVMIGPGSDSQNAVVRRMDAGVVGADGVLGYPPDFPRPDGGPVLMQPNTQPASRRGYGAAYASGFLYMFGGNPASPTASSDSAELCLGEGVGGCNPDRLPEVRNWNSTGTTMEVEPDLNNDGRALMGVATESAHFYVIGGANTGLNSATQSVEAVVQ